MSSTPVTNQGLLGVCSPLDEVYQYTCGSKQVPSGVPKRTHLEPHADESQPMSAEEFIIVGMGSAGCALGCKEGVRFFPSVELPDPVIDTNGAGDGLAVGFLSSYVLDGFPLVEAVCRGQITARQTCTQRASSSNLIGRELLERYFRDPTACSPVDG